MTRLRAIWAWALAVSLPPLHLGAHEPDLDAKIRAYILENPEVIVTALTRLAEREAKAALLAKLNAYPDLFTDPPVLGLGDPEASIRVVEFFDYRCAPCKAMHPALKTVAEEHPDLRIEMRQLPILSPSSERAARFALAVLQLYGAKAYDTVHQRLWTLRGPLNHISFAKIARSDALDFDAIETAMDSDAVSDRILRNREIAIDLEIFGTPAFVSPGSVHFGTTELNALVEDWLGS